MRNHNKKLPISKSILPNIKESVLLFVDDNDLFRSTMTKYMKNRYPSLKIFEGNCGEKALQITKQLIPDLIIIDINMKDMSGLTAISIIKNEYPFIPIIVLTNHDETEYYEAAKKAQADAFISKKNILSELFEIIDELLLNDNELNK